VALVGERRGDRNVHFSGALAMTACHIGRVARKSSTLFGRATSEYASAPNAADLALGHGLETA
jgi:hypothetical protein